MNQRDTFLVTDPGKDLDTHLWIVLSDPQQDSKNVLIVNITSWRSYCEQCCVLDPDDHPWIKRKSCVNYREADTISVEKFDVLQGKGLLDHREQIKIEVFEKILEGAAESKQMSLGKAEILINQGLIC